MSCCKTIVYSDKELLELVILYPDEFPMLYRLLSSYSEICLDISDNEYESLRNDENSIIRQFVTSEDVKVIPLHEFFVQLQESPQELIKHSRCIFFLNVSREEAIRLSLQYGVIVQSAQSPNDDLFGKNIIKGFYKGEPVKNGWEEVFSPISLCPRNSLVIKDKYLFENESGKIGVENIVSLLRVLMPNSFYGVFQILIISNPPYIRDDSIHRLVENLKTQIKNIFDYEVELEVFFFKSEIHKRRIFTGYQTVVCDKGFNLFNTRNNQRVVKDDNEFEIRTMFDLTKDNDYLRYSHSQFFIDSRDLQSISKECKNAGNRYLANKKDPSVYLCGDYNKKTCTSRNRLLNSV